MIDLAFFVTAFTTLFVVIDPFGTTPIFVALTQDMDAATRRKTAIRSCLTAVCILIAFAAFGEAVLGFVGISMEAFRVAGGALLFLTALDMLFDRRTKRREDRAEEEEHPDPSVFPLAIPLIAGPGSIATIILLAGQHPGVLGIVEACIVMLAVMAVVFIFFLSGGVIARILGKTGLNVLTRLLGMLLAALSVQFILDGLKAFGFAS
ncbi:MULTISPECIES: MarC family protein [Ruegeria]|uniref:MarC family protein n=1 Tax=Ruegeria TaxID=97050 RepID=UPI00147AD79E|nr:MULTISPECIES: MarC family protein [Ruegeria]MBO9412750.1 MarC family protein [Ruegeria sp. R8_1]MBO9416702.1 MarC family protein [Ruegeria sp. R8_2]